MKVLVIEDNPVILNALQKKLERKHVLVDEASDGLSGLKKLKNNFYDLVIVDLGLPKMSGEKLIKEARSWGIRTPILVLTVTTDVDKKVELLETWADDYMEKPYSFEELFARINAILRRNNQSFSKKQDLKLDDLEIFPDKRAATRAGKEIVLTRKEYDLLSYLMSHLNKVVSRQEILEEVWGYSPSSFSNTVDVHVSSLRQKIDKGHKKKLIKTIHGIGYVMESKKTLK